MSERQIADLASTRSESITEREERAYRLIGIAPEHRVRLETRVVRSGGTIPKKQHAVRQEGGAARRMARQAEHLHDSPADVQAFSVTHASGDPDSAPLDCAAVWFEHVNLRAGKRPRAADVIGVFVREKDGANVA